MPVYVIADVKITDDSWVPDYAAEPNGAVGTLRPEVEPLGAGQQTPIQVPLLWYGSEPPSDPTVVRLVRVEDVVAVAEGAFGESAIPRLPPQNTPIRCSRDRRRSGERARYRSMARFFRHMSSRGAGAPSTVTSTGPSARTVITDRTPAGGRRFRSSAARGTGRATTARAPPPESGGT